ncbi:MAG: hypothetical protein PHC61_00700 [Chitinivibrionales bacterium]|nr:hypothetical protein [Chitinivibrionales bacterium]
MTEKENKKEAAMIALQKIRERIKPQPVSANAASEEIIEEDYQGVKIRTDVGRGLVQMFFPKVPSDKVRRYLKKHGFVWDVGERCWQSDKVDTAGYHARRAVDGGGKK